MSNWDRQALDRVTFPIIQGAIEVHRHLGAGLLESLYRECLIQELTDRGLELVVEKRIPVFYKGRALSGS